MPKYLVQVTKAYDPNAEDLYPSCDPIHLYGIFPIAAVDRLAALNQVNQLLDRSKPDPLQSCDSKILWNARTPKGDLIDFSFQSTGEVFEEMNGETSTYTHIH